MISEILSGGPDDAPWAAAVDGAMVTIKATVTMAANAAIRFSISQLP
jgi:hypothetical protein